MATTVSEVLVDNPLDSETIYRTKAEMPSSVTALLVTRTLGSECQNYTKTVMPSVRDRSAGRSDVGQRVTTPKQGRDALIRDRHVV